MKKKIITVCKNEDVRKVNITSSVNMEIPTGYIIKGFQRPGSQSYPHWEKTGSVYTVGHDGSTHACSVDCCLWDTQDDPMNDIAHAFDTWFGTDADRLEIWYKDRFLGVVYPTEKCPCWNATKNDRYYHFIFTAKDVKAAFDIIEADF